MQLEIQVKLTPLPTTLETQELHSTNKLTLSLQLHQLPLLPLHHWMLEMLVLFWMMFRFLEILEMLHVLKLQMNFAMVLIKLNGLMDKDIIAGTTTLDSFNAGEIIQPIQLIKIVLSELDVFALHLAKNAATTERVLLANKL